MTKYRVLTYFERCQRTYKAGAIEDFSELDAEQQAYAISEGLRLSQIEVVADAGAPEVAPAPDAAPATPIFSLPQQ
jgi:hypothetical protein